MPRQHHATHASPRAVRASPYVFAFLPLLLPIAQGGNFKTPSRRRSRDKYAGDTLELLSPAQAVIHQLLSSGHPVIINLNAGCRNCICRVCSHGQRVNHASETSSSSSSFAGDADDEILPRLQTPATALERHHRSSAPVPYDDGDYNRQLDNTSSADDSTVSDRTARPQRQKRYVSPSIIAEPSPMFSRHDGVHPRVLTYGSHSRPKPRKPRAKVERPIDGMSEFDIELWRHSAARSSAMGSMGPPPYEHKRGAGLQTGVEHLIGNVEPAAYMAPPVSAPLPTSLTVYMDVCQTAQAVHMDVSTPRPFGTGVLLPPPASGWPRPLSPTPPQTALASEVSMLSRRTISQPAHTPRGGTPMDWEAGNETEPPGFAVAEPSAQSAPVPFRSTLHARLRQASRQRRALQRRAALDPSFSALEKRVETLSRPMTALVTPALSVVRAAGLTGPAMVAETVMEVSVGERSCCKRRLSEVADVDSPVEPSRKQARSALSAPSPRPGNIGERGTSMTSRKSSKPHSHRKRKRDSASPLQAVKAALPSTRPIRHLPKSDLAAFDAASKSAGPAAEEAERLRLAELEFERLFADGFSLGFGLDGDAEEDAADDAQDARDFETVQMRVEALARDEFSADVMTDNVTQGD